MRLLLFAGYYSYSITSSILVVLDVSVVIAVEVVVINVVVGVVPIHVDITHIIVVYYYYYYYSN